MFIKIKLEDRITLSFAGLFLVLILLSNFLTIYFLKRQSMTVIERTLDQKEKEINIFLERIDAYSQRYDSLSLDYTPQIEKNRVVYPKPFEPGNENYLYVFQINDEILINSFYNFEFGNHSSNAENVLKTLDQHFKEKINGKSSTISFGKNEIYMYKNVTRNISGNVFKIYILKNISQENKIFDRLRVLILFFTVLGILITIFLSSL